jgi:hypothetical protein
MIGLTGEFLDVWQGKELGDFSITPEQEGLEVLTQTLRGSVQANTDQDSTPLSFR